MYTLHVYSPSKRGSMKFSKFDIGAEIISILTRGMYPDPKDALREYIQNGVDAKATHVDVKIRQNNIIIQDNGYGMDYATLRKAARIGVSDKNPSKDVGFMGIGIYSAYHLCDTLTIISKKEGGTPNKLVMHFSEMKNTLKSQRDLRLSGEIDSDKAVDLQTLLESFVDITDDGKLEEEIFPKVGTRVELSGVSEYFYSEISNIDIIFKYLQEVIPLKFDSDKFKYAAQIDEAISSACVQNKNAYESINLTLQVNSEQRELFKPYQNSDFHNDDAANAYIQPINGDDGTFYGVMWGCLNSDRKKIKNSELRGFLIKKQGFAIGKRSDVVRYFPRGNTFFDRYIGEIIITNSQLLPNASRNDIEYSPIRERFFSALSKLTSMFDDIANEYQENCKADAILDELIRDTQEVSIDTNMSLQNSDDLLKLYTRLSLCKKTLSDRIKTRRMRETRMPEAKGLEKKIINLMSFIQERLTINNEKKKADVSESEKLKKELPRKRKAPDFSKFKPIMSDQEKVKYETLLSLVDDLEFKYDNNIRILLDIIDERFIQALAKNKEDYYNLLLNLRQEFLDED